MVTRHILAKEWLKVNISRFVVVCSNHFDDVTLILMVKDIHPLPILNGVNSANIWLRFRNRNYQDALGAKI
jgi:hypothetical protein